MAPGSNHQSKGGLTPLIDATLSGHAAIVARSCARAPIPSCETPRRCDRPDHRRLPRARGRRSGPDQGKADVNALDAQGFTPLHYAIDRNREEAARFCGPPGQGIGRPRSPDLPRQLAPPSERSCNLVLLR